MLLEAQGPVGILRMGHGSANAISASFLDELTRVLDELDASEARAVVITGEGRAFSAGLDLPSLQDLDRPGITAFITRFNSSMRRLFEISLPVVAAVNGHAIAGGCVIAMQADERFMATGDHKIGLNEAALGIGLPTVVLESFRAGASADALREIAQLGRLVGPEEARNLGIVQQLCEPDELVERAVERAASIAETTGQAAFAQIKAVARRPYLERVDRYGAQDTEAWVDTWCSTEAKERLGALIAKLRR